MDKSLSNLIQEIFSNSLFGNHLLASNVDKKLFYAHESCKTNLNTSK